MHMHMCMCMCMSLVHCAMHLHVHHACSCASRMLVVCIAHVYVHVLAVCRTWGPARCVNVRVQTNGLEIQGQAHCGHLPACRLVAPLTLSALCMTWPCVAQARYGVQLGVDWPSQPPPSRFEWQVPAHVSPLATFPSAHAPYLPAPRASPSQLDVLAPGYHGRWGASHWW